MNADNNTKSYGIILSAVFAVLSPITATAVCTDAPEVSVTATPSVLWAPNHQYVTVNSTVIVSNACSAVTITLVSIESNEPDNGLGDADTDNDIVIIDDFTADLRSERSGRGTGRIYTLTYRATDAYGNTSTAEANVIVPLNKSD